MISTRPLGVGGHSPVSVPVTRIVAVVGLFGIGGMPTTEVTEMEHGIRPSVSI
jgi:hypothetical protein